MALAGLKKQFNKANQVRVYPFTLPEMVNYRSLRLVYGSLKQLSACQSFSNKRYLFNAIPCPCGIQLGEVRNNSVYRESVSVGE